jgi:ketosteroid isomerase-like protein
MTPIDENWLRFHADLLQANAVPAPGLTPEEIGTETRAVEQLLIALAVNIDRQDVEAIVALYDADGTVETAVGTARGTEEIRRNYVELGSIFDRTLHCVNNVTVRIDGPTEARAAAFNFTIATKRDGHSYSFGGANEDTLVKRDGRWLFKSHKVVDGMVYALEEMSADSRFGDRDSR